MDTISYTSVQHTDSKIFSGYRTIGHVSNHVPALLRYIHKRRENFVISCTGHSFNTYAGQELKLLTVSPTHDGGAISCMGVDTYHVYTASNNLIYAWRRGTELKHTYKGHTGEIKCLLPFGQHLISLDINGELAMYDIKTEERVWDMQFDLAEFAPTCLMHPYTYINQIIVGTSQGRFRLLDVNTGQNVQDFNGWNSEILQIVQAPVVDIIAISLVDKRIIIHDLKKDKTVMTLQCLDKPISIAFPTDERESLIVGSDIGSLTVWDLNSREMISYKQDAHRGPVCGIQCFPQEPLFVTSSSDNSIKVWIFDLPDGGYRLLNSRAGHHKPSNRIRFYGTPAYSILSAGGDSSLRTFHIYNETYSRCISKARIPVEKLGMTGSFSNDDDYMPQIVDFTIESATNPKHYADIAACHNGQLSLSTWSIANTKRSDKILVPTKDNSAKYATCLCMSACGQFVIAGYDNGSVHRFNIQSGIHRKTYGEPFAHEGSVRGVAVDQVNTTVVSGGVDCLLKFWKFDTGDHFKNISVDCAISSLFFHRTSSLVGLVLDNCSIVIVDIATICILRRMTELASPILNACFSPDCRWVTASTSDCLVRTWDVPTSTLIDVFRLESIVCSMDYSPNGEFLATALHDTVGIVLWMNKTLFARVSLMPLPKDFEPPLLGLPTNESMEIASSDNEEDEDATEFYDPMDDNLITLSLTPSVKWKSLLHMDTIRMRNRPKQPPKTMVAPFFLSTIVSNEEAAAGSDQTPSEIVPTNGSKIMKFEISLSPFGRKLKGFEATQTSCTELCELLSSMSPTKIEAEFRDLGPDTVGSTELLKDFLIFINLLIKSNRSFELSEAYLALFLKIHGDDVREHPALLDSLTIVQESLEKRDEILQKQVTTVLGCTYFLKSTLFT